MSRLLAIETSAESCSAALDIEGEVRERFEHAPMKHAELLLPMVSSLLADAGIRASELDAIAFGRGPGSFTSLRIGIGVVQGLAWGAEVGVVPVSSLAAAAQAAIEKLPSLEYGGQILVAMDARMQEVFKATFTRGEDGTVRAAGEEAVSPPSAVAAGGNWVAVGNGFDRYQELVDLAKESQACLPDVWPRAGSVLRLARQWMSENEPLPAGLAQPVYIRNDVAQKPGRS